MAIFLVFLYGSWLLTVVCVHYLLLRRSVDTVNPQHIRLFRSLAIAYACALCVGYATLFFQIPIFLVGGYFALYVSGVVLASFSTSFLAVLGVLQPSIAPRRMIVITGVLWLTISVIYLVCAAFFQAYLDEDFLLVTSLVMLSLPCVMGISYWFNISWKKATVRFAISIACIVGAIVLVMSIYTLATNGGRVDNTSDEWVTYSDVSANFSISYPSTLLPERAVGGTGESYIRFYDTSDPEIPSITVTVAPVVRQIESRSEAPLYWSCTDDVPMGVIDFQSRTLHGGVMSERFLDKSPSGVVGNYIFVARSHENCYIIRAIGPGYRMHMDDLDKLFDSFSLI